MSDQVIEIIKFVGSFITFFFMWKKYGEKIKVTAKESINERELFGINIAKLMSCKELMITILTSVAWFYVIPLYLAWMLLEKVYSIFTTRNKDKKDEKV